MKKLLYAVIFLVIFVFGLTFAARNPHYVSIDYYFGIDVEVPLIAVILVSLAAGVVLGYLFSLAGGYRRYRRRRQAMATGAGGSTGTSIVTRGG
jgi:uncharacterized integral membrane protein